MDLPDSPPSLWLAEYGPYQPEPSLAADISVDVAVIGPADGYRLLTPRGCLQAEDTFGEHLTARVRHIPADWPPAPAVRSRRG